MRSGHVFVSGGAGYLGSVMVPMLLDEGYEVTVMDRLYFGREPLAPVLDNPRFHLIEGDITDLAAHNGFLDGVDAVIHLAALSNDPSSDLDPARTQRVNYEATMELARRAARAGVKRFIMASSCSVFGSDAAPIVDESSMPEPVSIYAKTKVESERDLFTLSAPGMAITALRMATLYGLSPRMRFDLAVNLMTMNAVTKRSIYVMGGGSQWRPFLHVVDASRAFMTALQAPAETIDRDVFNIGSEQHNYQISDLALLVQSTLSDLDVAVTAWAGPHAYVEGHAADARLIQGMRGHFHAHRFGPGIGEFRHQGMYAQGVGRGVQGRIELPGITAAERADQTATREWRVQNLREQIRGGGFAIGTGDADHLQAPRRRAMETIGDGTDMFAQIFHGDGIGITRV